MEGFFYIRVFVGDNSILCTGLPNVEFLILNSVSVVCFETNSSRIVCEINYRVCFNAFGSAVLGHRHFE